MSNNVAAVVVWYNPWIDILSNIDTYIDSVDRLFVVDNSPNPNAQCVALLAGRKNVQYIALMDNKGIAYALNRGMQLAYEQGFQWVLTMDQDSVFSNKAMGLMFDVLGQIVDPEKVGILAAVPSCSAHVKTLPDTRWSLIETAFTSGNLVRTQAWLKSGGWNEDLFIDSVDYDFDFRVQMSGYLVVRCNDAIFEHQLGELRALKFCGKKLFIATNHNHVRRYYITRNRLYINHRYRSQFPAFVRSERFSNFKELIKIIFYEKDKLRKLRSIWRGYCDYRNGIMGKYRW